MWALRAGASVVAVALVRASHTCFYDKIKEKGSDYGLHVGMDLVSKLVPVTVTENLKSTAHFIFEKMDCGDEKKLTWQKSSHETFDPALALHCTGRADVC